MQSIIYIPQLEKNELEDIISIMSDKKWVRSMNPVLKKIHNSADENLMKLNRTPEENGYWKGIKTLVADLLEFQINVQDQKKAEANPEEEPDEL